VKQFLLSSALGPVAMRLRDKYEIVSAALKTPESVGTIACDHLATKLITRLCLPGYTFVDVGAHIGSVISEVRRQTLSAKIIAVEAIPSKAAQLRKRFKFAKIIECAVGETSGEVSFFVHKYQSGYSSLYRPTSQSSTPFTEIRIPMERLDSLVEHSGVSAIKIDVEGAELSVLIGAQLILKNSRPIVMFESAPADPARDADEKTKLYEFLLSLNYCVVLPNRLAHNDDGLSCEGFRESHLYPRRATNYFAVPIERRLEFRDRARLIVLR
jgi:FkbM family methyltransferase